MPEASGQPAGIDEQLFTAAERGDIATLASLLDAHPDKLHVRRKPYDSSLLHIAARHVGIVDLLLARGLDVNTRENGDNTYAMHWAAAAGELDVVRRLADAGGDVVGRGDDHELDVIGWATCWDPCQDAVAQFLVSRGARHHIFSAIAMNLGDEVRRIVAGDPSALGKRQSRNENHRTPLHFAVLKNRREMIALLLELGADPLAVDSWGMPAAVHAGTPDIDLPVMKRIRATTMAEIDSAARGFRPPRSVPIDLVALLALREWDTAARLVRENRALIEPRGGVLHLMAKRNDPAAVKWLLDQGADPSGRWDHWDAAVTPLHLAVLNGNTEIARILLAAGADTTIADSLHQSDALGWAAFFDRSEIVAMIKAQRAGSSPASS